MIITKEMIAFVYFVISGMVGGIFFDFMRAFRHNRKWGDLIVYLEDIVYWLIVTGMLILLTYRLDAGPLRLYMIIGFFLGMIIYLLGLSKIVYKVLDVFCRYLLRIFRWVFNLFKGGRHEKNVQSD